MPSFHFSPSNLSTYLRLPVFCSPLLVWYFARHLLLATSGPGGSCRYRTNLSLSPYKPLHCMLCLRCSLLPVWYFATPARS